MLETQSNVGHQNDLVQRNRIWKSYITVALISYWKHLHWKVNVTSKLMLNTEASLENGRSYIQFVGEISSRFTAQ